MDEVGKPKTIFVIFFGLFFLSFFILLYPSCKKAQEPPGPKEKVTLGVGSPFLAMPIILAQEKGFYSNEGLEATLKHYPSGQKAMEAMFSGEVDIATVADTPLVLTGFIRDDFVVFATFVSSYDENKVLGRRDRGVSTPSDLRGKTIGIVKGTSSDFFAHVYLTEHLIDPSTVKLVDLQPTDLPSALTEGRVDAIVVFGVHAYRALKALPGRIAKLPPSDLYRLTFNLTCRREVAKGNPGVLRKVLKAVDKGIVHINRYHEESIALISKAFGIDKDAFERNDLIYELSLSHTLVVTLEDEARWAIARRLTDKTKVPNYLDYVYPDAMREVRPDAVTVARER